MIAVVPFVQDHFALARPLSEEAYYPDLWESEEAFDVRLRLFPAGCLSAFVDGAYAGYVFGHPWSGEHISLGTVIKELPERPEYFYVHDLLVGKAFRGRGIGTALFGYLLSVAKNRDLHEMRLVSVLGSEPFWKRCGFETIGGVSYAPNVLGKIMVRNRK